MKKVKAFILMAIISVCMLMPFSNAHAVTPSGFDFLQAISAKAGLTIPEFIATIAGISATSSGVSLANDAGIAFDKGMDNLDNLIDAADYPAWDTLSESDKTAWGSKQNYDASKFNSLLGAFGLADARDGFYSSGGANFEWQDDWIDRANAIGRIGNTWAGNGYNTLQSILNTTTDKEVLENFAGKSNYAQVKGSDVPTWQSSYPEYVYVNRVNQISQTLGASYKETITYNNDNYVIAWEQGGYLYRANFDLSYFSQVKPYNVDSRTATYNGHTYYWLQPSYLSVGNNPYTTNLQLSSGVTTSNVQGIAARLLFDYTLTVGNVETIPSYPSNINIYEGDTPIFYPSQITPTVNWDEFIDKTASSAVHVIVDNTPLEVVFDGLDEVIQRLDLIIKMLSMPSPSDLTNVISSFDFDDVQNKIPQLVQAGARKFPFAGFAIAGSLIAVWTQIQQISEPVFHMDFDFFNVHHVVDLQLGYLADVRPLFNFMTLTMLVLCFVRMSIRLIEMEAAS